MTKKWLVGVSESLQGLNWDWMGARILQSKGIGEDSLYNVWQGEQRGNMAGSKKTPRNQTTTTKNGVETSKSLLKMVIKIRVMGIKTRLKI